MSTEETGREPIASSTPGTSTAPEGDIRALNAKIKEESAFIELIKLEMEKVIIGQHDMVDKLLIALLANGHILLEGVPGLAKTLAIKALSGCISVDFSRLQFTPDLLPADVVGTMIYNPKTQDFTVKQGPIFANFVLADEINRAPAKVQSALLEAMQERQVTIGGQTFSLPEPFLVLATQNPIEQEGTYPLPEAQVDRFMLKVVLTYPKREEERIIIRNNVSKAPFPKPKSVVSAHQVLQARETVKEVYMDEKIEKYIVDLVYATRDPEAYKLKELKELIGFGASPRAGISMALAAKAYAFMNHRGFVVPEDVRAVCPDVMRHRIGLTYEAEAENVSVEDVIQQVLNAVEVP